MKIVGIRNVDYVSKKTGEHVQGVSLHCVSPFALNRGLGDEVERVWLPLEVWGTLNRVAAGDPDNIIGKGCEVTYNKYGDVTDVCIVPVAD